MSLRSFKGNKENEISFLTQLSKDYLHAVPEFKAEQQQTQSKSQQTMYSIECVIQGKTVGKGFASSQKKAKYLAVQSALQILSEELWEEWKAENTPQDVYGQI